MALGKKKQANLNFLILKIKNKDAEGKQVSPFFQVTKKVDDKWVVQEDAPTTVSGKIAKIQPRVTEYQGEKIPRIDVFLNDGEDGYLIELKYTMLSRSILNALLTLTDSDKEVEIDLYENKKGYASAAVRANGESLKWKFSLDELPKPEVVKFKGKEQRDFTAVDNFFEEAVLVWSKELLSGNKSGIVEDGAGAESDTESAVDDKSLF
jgi:hypothetical protein